MCRAGVCFNLSWIRNDYHDIWPSPFLLFLIWRIRTGDQVVNHVYTSDHADILGAAMCLIWTYWYSPPVPTAADTKRSINLGLKSGQRRRRWTNVKPTLIQRLVSAGRPIPYQTQDIDPKSNYCRNSVADGELTLHQSWRNILALPGCQWNTSKHEVKQC